MDATSAIGLLIPPKYQPYVLALLAVAYSITQLMALYQPTAGYAAKLRPILNVIAGNTGKAAIDPAVTTPAPSAPTK